MAISANRPSGGLLRLHELRDAAEVAAGVAATDLVAPLDQHDAEAAVAGQQIAGHLPVAGLEHVQRQQLGREQHDAQREHRELDLGRCHRQPCTGLGLN